MRKMFSVCIHSRVKNDDIFGVDNVLSDFQLILVCDRKMFYHCVSLKDDFLTVHHFSS